MGVLVLVLDIVLKHVLVAVIHLVMEIVRAFVARVVLLLVLVVVLTLVKVNVEDVGLVVQTLVIVVVGISVLQRVKMELMAPHIIQTEVLLR